MWKQQSRYLALVVVATLLASLGAPARFVHAGLRWTRLSGEGFLPEQVCRDGIRFGFVTQGSGPFSLKADRNIGSWVDASTVIATRTLAPPVVDPPWIVDYGAESGGFFTMNRAEAYAFRWSEQLAVGTQVKMRIDLDPTVPDDFINDPKVTVDDCSLFDLGLTMSDSPDPVLKGGQLAYTLAPRNLGSITPIAPTRGFANTNPIPIPGSGRATLYPSSIPVSGLAGNITKVSVTLQDFTHPALADIDMLLVGPGGQKVMLMSDAGAGNSLGFEPVTFDDEASAPIPSGTEPIGFKSHRPANYGLVADTFPAPAPGGPYGTALSAFNGTGANGTWSLYIVDDSSLNSGTGNINGGWSLTITTDAVAVTVKDTLPVGTTFVSASGTNWTCSAALPVVTCTTNYQGTSQLSDISIVVAPQTLGTIVNSALVASTLVEPNTANNTATSQTTVKVGVFLPLVRR